MNEHAWPDDGKFVKAVDRDVGEKCQLRRVPLKTDVPQEKTSANVDGSLSKTCSRHPVRAYSGWPNGREDPSGVVSIVRPAVMGISPYV